MTPTALKTLLLGTVFFSLVVNSTFIPLAEDQYSNHAIRKRASLDIKKTTVSKEGTTIDWIPIASQGKIAALPPLPEKFLKAGSSRIAAVDNSTVPIAELELEGTEVGPAGTVPIPRVDITFAFLRSKSKAPPPAPKTDKLGNKLPASKDKKRQYQGYRWYVNSYKRAASIGASATFSMFKPYVQNPGDFSLLQTALGKGPGTLEAGWQYYRGDASSDVKLFTYFTVNGYTAGGDYLGGYNSDILGWVQVDSTYFPGMTFASRSTINGPQYELHLEFELIAGNWWLFVQDRWIGYYPAHMYSDAQPTIPASATLALGADITFFYGEIYQTENARTRTDMGSGHFAKKGYKKAAYIRNMMWKDENHFLVDYDEGLFYADDAKRYSFATPEVPGNTGDWGTYTFIGGPGNHGDVGA